MLTPAVGTGEPGNDRSRFANCELPASAVAPLAGPNRPRPALLMACGFVGESTACNSLSSATARRFSSAVGSRYRDWGAGVASVFGATEYVRWTPASFEEPMAIWPGDLSSSGCAGPRSA